MSKDDDILTEAEAKRLIKGSASADPAKRAKPQKGDPGPRGKPGEDGRDGKDGKDGRDGKDGILATKALDDLKPGEEVKTLQVEVVVVKGKDGKDGKDGRDGKDGARGEKGDPGRNGKDGSAGKDGRDGADGRNGRGIPKGGRRNQVLKKNSDEDFDTYWGDEPQPGGGIVVQGGSGTGIVESVTGLDTDNTDPANPIIRIATDSSLTGAGTPDDPLSASGLIIEGGVIFKGVIDCSTNPNYPTADAGWLYRVSVAGKIGGASGPNVEVGDTLLCLVDGSPAGNHATVGANWNISQVNIDGAVIGPTSATNNAIALFDGVTGKLIKDSATIIDTDPALAADSDQRIATQKAVKAYVDANLPDFDIQIITSTGQWNKPAGNSGKKRVRVILIGAGGGAGAGRKGASGNRFGGQGGGAGRVTIMDYISDQLGSAEDVVIGAGGDGAISQTTNDTNGGSGTSGGDSLFGGTTLATAKQAALGGSLGSGGSTIGISPGTATINTGYQFTPAAQIGTTTGAGITGTRAALGPGAGASGAGLPSAGTESAGALGGSALDAPFTTSNTLGGSAGATNGGDGGDGADGSPYGSGDKIYGSGGGSGGSNAGGDGGDGGNGGYPGGGGGGGGACDNSGNSGAGGDGADGLCIVISEI